MLSCCECLYREEEQFHFSLQDFKCVAVLGRGHFGKVHFIYLTNMVAQQLALSPHTFDSWVWSSCSPRVSVVFLLPSS